VFCNADKLLYMSQKDQDIEYLEKYKFYSKVSDKSCRFKKIYLLILSYFDLEWRRQSHIDFFKWNTLLLILIFESNSW